MNTSEYRGRIRIEEPIVQISVNEEGISKQRHALPIQSLNHRVNGPIYRLIYICTLLKLTRVY